MEGKKTKNKKHLLEMWQRRGKEKFQEKILLMVKMKNEEVEVLQNLSRVHQSHTSTSLVQRGRRQCMLGDRINYICLF